MLSAELQKASPIQLHTSSPFLSKTLPQILVSQPTLAFMSPITTNRSPRATLHPFTCRPHQVAIVYWCIDLHHFHPNVLYLKPDPQNLLINTLPFPQNAPNFSDNNIATPALGLPSCTPEYIYIHVESPIFFAPLPSSSPHLYVDQPMPLHFVHQLILSADYCYVPTSQSAHIVN